SRAAFSWPVEAAALVAENRATELPRIGPHLARLLRGWVESDVAAPEPPPVRRDFLTLTEARAVLAADPGWAAALRGDLQTHTLWSDGTATIAAMAEAAAARGHSYLAITDHTRTLHIAGGLDETRLRAQADEIAGVNAALDGRLRVLRAAEMNLSPAGEGDMPPASLAALEIVLGAFHSALRRTDDQTERYLAALRNPHFDVLAHPRGRIYDFRLGLSADWPRVFAAAAEADKAVEIDAYPDRQDLNVALLEQARAAGVRISLGSDAHAPDQLAAIELGLAAARKAGIRRERIVNFLSADALVAWAAARR
ncbi:MAG TPA: PHP domain-containing protein, partial [Candidatus Binatia bacterium]|nr:PHP domain-containing protein [Candidatus Binatia bacterium]